MNNPCQKFFGALQQRPTMRVRFGYEGRAEHVLCMTVRVHETGSLLNLQQAVPVHLVSKTQAWAAALPLGAAIEVDVPKVSLSLHAKDVASIKLAPAMRPGDFRGAILQGDML
jgi:hypothetical protein